MAPVLDLIYLDHIMIVSWSYIYRILIIFWPYPDRILIILWSYPDRILIIYWSYPDRILIEFWSHPDLVLILSWSNSDHILILSWSYTDHILIVSWTYPAHILAFCWNLMLTDVTPCSLVSSYRRFGSAHCLHFQGPRIEEVLRHFGNYSQVDSVTSQILEILPTSLWESRSWERKEIWIHHCLSSGALCNNGAHAERTERSL